MQQRLFMCASTPEQVVGVHGRSILNGVMCVTVCSCVDERELLDPTGTISFCL